MEAYLSDKIKKLVAHSEGNQYLFNSRIDAELWIFHMETETGNKYSYSHPERLENSFWRVIVEKGLDA